MTTPTQQAYAELQQAYDHFNQALFDGVLPDCLLTLQREKHTYGYFSRSRFISIDGRQVDEIALNPSYFAVIPIVEILQTVAHEMCHLWQHHHGTPGRGRYHNDEWGGKMEFIGLMPSSTGMPGGRRTGDRVADYTIDGGRFLEACRTLITDDFKISWLDRFPSTKQILSASCLPSLDLSPDVGGGSPPMHELLAASLDAVRGEGAAVLVSPREPTRTRYVCPCGVKLWGKPDLRIQCLACDGLFAG